MAILNSNGTSSDTQTQINNASNGDTVLLPAGGSFTWSTSDVSIPDTKYIKLDGNNSTVTLSNGVQLFADNHATGNTEFTRFNFIINHTSSRVDFGDVNASNLGTLIFSNSTVTINREGLQSSMEMFGRARVLWYGITVTGIRSSQEFIHINGWGAGNTTGWTNDTGASLAGSQHMNVIEDCTFIAEDGANAGWIQGYYGCRVTIRHCTFDYVSIDMHGTAGGVGARWWEIYENTFDNDSGNNHAWAVSMRAGSGVVYNNEMAPGADHEVNYGFCEEDTGYPADYQIGRGLNQTSDPAYVWNNNEGAGVDVCDAPEQTGMVQLNRDVFEEPRPGYTALEYPHPLRENNSPEAPSNLRILNVKKIINIKKINNF